MKRLTYSADIAAPKEVVWFCITDQNSYRQWADAFSKNSQFKGEFKQGEEVLFFDPDMGGTVAYLEEVIQPNRIKCVHNKLLDKNMEEETDTERAKKWIGTKEDYYLDEVNNTFTRLKVEVECHEDFVDMFEKMWPNAIQKLAGVAEGQMDEGAVSFN